MNTLQNNGCGGGVTTGGAGCITTGNIQFYPSGQPWYGYPNYQYLYTTVAPTECSGDVHVFPCAKCKECKCGKAKLSASK